MNYYHYHYYYCTIIFIIFIQFTNGYKVYDNNLNFKLLNGNVWHITDTHYDFSYKAGGDPDDMCREVTHTIDPLMRGAYGSIESNVASPVGNYRCDTPYSLLISSFEEMVKLEPNPDFIIWTGDDVPHFDNDDLDQNLVLQSISNMTDLIQYYFPGVRIFPSIGNHDSYPQHQIGIGPNWLLTEVSEIWSGFLSEESIQTFKIGGYYSELVEEGFRIISLNTVFYYTENKQCLNLTDPAGQFQWLNQTLYQARENQEKVWIIAHVSPGYNEKYDIFNFHKQFNDIYLTAFSNYSDIIVAHFYGHEHTDTFRLYYDQDTSIFSKHQRPGSEFSVPPPTGIMFLSPSLTPWMTPYLPALPNNPAIRMYQYNTSGYQVLDYLQYWTNLTANVEVDEINWMLEYRATQFYNVPALDPISMYEGYLLLENDPAMLTLFHFFNSVSYPTKGCDEICKKIQLCSIRHPYVKGFQTCLLMYK